MSAAARPFNRPGWIWELKYDGFRCLASKVDGLVRMVSRQGRGMGHAFPELTDELHALPDGVVLDSELVVLDERGHPQFEDLCARAFMSRAITIRRAAVERPAAMFAFDVLMVEGRDVRNVPLLKRKVLLEGVLAGSNRVRYLSHVGENGERLYAEVERLELEGVVGKRADAPYTAGRSPAWVKVKTPAGKEREAKRRERG